MRPRPVLSETSRKWRSEFSLTRRFAPSMVMRCFSGSLHYSSAILACSSSVLEPYARFISLVFVTESCLKDFFFLACSINLQWDDCNEKPQSARLVDVEKDPRDRQTSEN